MRIYSAEGSSLSAIRHDCFVSRQDSVRRHNADLIKRRSRRQRIKHAFLVAIAPFAIIFWVHIMYIGLG